MSIIRDFYIRGCSYGAEGGDNRGCYYRGVFYMGVYYKGYIKGESIIGLSMLGGAN